MMKFSVNYNLCLLFIVCLFNLPAEAQRKYIRYNSASEIGQKHLKAYEEAVGEMKKLPCDDPRSWFFQGAIHGVALPDSIGDNVNRQDPKDFEDPMWCEGYRDKYRQFANVQNCNEPWGTCHHKYSSEPFTFLVWHRLYLYHFERTLRSFMADESDFALPYWNYAVKKNRAIPSLFRDSNYQLYTNSRREIYNNFNRSKKIKIFKPRPSKGDQFDTILNQHLANESWNGFLSELGLGVHSEIHTAVGDYSKKNKIENEILRKKSKKGLMTNTVTAGYDPLFFVHHVEVDRLWEYWKGKYPKQADNVNLMELRKDDFHNYIFYDPELGHVKYSIEAAWKKFLEIQSTIFYDSIPSSTLIEQQQVAGQQNNHLELMNWSASVPIEADGKAIIDIPEHAAFGLFQESDFAKEKQLEFVLQIVMQLSFDEEPGAVSVYIKDDVDKKEFHIGDIGFFGATHDHGSSGEHQRFVYDVLFELPPELESLDVFDLESGETNHDFELIFRSSSDESSGLQLESFKLDAVILR